MPGSEEFRRAVRLQHHLAGTHYLLFLKRSPDGGMRWALYRPNPRLLNEVRSRYAALRQHQVSTDG